MRTACSAGSSASRSSCRLSGLRCGGGFREGYGWKLAGIFALGGLQGALGWYMVKSGLVDDPRVSQFRLTAHLTLAFLIFGAMLWVALSLLFPRRTEPMTDAASSARRWAIAVARAGCDDGRHGRIRRRDPRGLRVQHVSADERRDRPRGDPDARAGVEELLLEHGHRAVRSPPWSRGFCAFSCRCCGGSCAAVGAIPTRARVGANALLAMLIVQLALGIATLLLVVPLPLAALHQAGAVLVFALAINVVHAFR